MNKIIKLFLAFAMAFSFNLNELGHVHASVENQEVCNHDDGNAFSVVEGETITVTKACGSILVQKLVCNLCGEEILGDVVDDSQLNHTWIKNPDIANATYCDYFSNEVCSVCDENSRDGDFYHLSLHVENQRTQNTLCGTISEIEYRCDTCNDSYTENKEIDVQHNYVPYTLNDCTVTLVDCMKCTRCNTLTNSARLPGAYEYHEFDENSEPTWLVDFGGNNIYGYQCVHLNCDVVEYFVSDCFHDSWIVLDKFVTRQGPCGLEKYQVVKCTDCGYEMITSKINRAELNHDMVLNTYINTDECYDGPEYICTKCQDGYGHIEVHTNPEIIETELSQSECGSFETKDYHCLDCDKYWDEWGISSLNHQYVDIERSDCTGYHSINKLCQNCGFWYENGWYISGSYNDHEFDYDSQPTWVTDYLGNLIYGYKCTHPNCDEVRDKEYDCFHECLVNTGKTISVQTPCGLAKHQVMKCVECGYETTGGIVNHDELDHDIVKNTNLSPNDCHYYCEYICTKCQNGYGSVDYHTNKALVDKYIEITPCGNVEWAVYECLDCHNIWEENNRDTLIHHFVDFHQCSGNDTTSLVCLVCGYLYFDGWHIPGEYNDHEFDMSAKPTWVEDFTGILVYGYQCIHPNCKATTSREFDCDHENMSIVLNCVVTQNSPCGEIEYRVLKCDDCGYETLGSKLNNDKLNHEWVEPTQDLVSCDWVPSKVCKKCGEHAAGGQMVHIGNHIDEQTRTELTQCGIAKYTYYTCDKCGGYECEEDRSLENHRYVPFKNKDCTGHCSDSQKCTICGYVEVGGCWIAGEYEDHEFSSEAIVAINEYGDIDYGYPCIHENCQVIMHFPIECNHNYWQAFKKVEGKTLTVETLCGIGQKEIYECELCGYQEARNWVDESVFEHHFVPYTVDEIQLTQCQLFPLTICDQCGEFGHQWKNYHVANRVVDQEEYVTEHCGTGIVTSYKCDYCGESSQELDDSQMHHNYKEEQVRPNCQGYYSKRLVCQDCGREEIAGEFIEPTAPRHVYSNTSEYIETYTYGQCYEYIFWGYKCLNDNCEDYMVDPEKTQEIEHHQFISSEPHPFKEGCVQGTRIENRCELCDCVQYEDSNVVGSHTFNLETYYDCEVGEYDNQQKCQVCGLWELSIFAGGTDRTHEMDYENLDVVNIDESNPDAVIVQYGYKCTHSSYNGVPCAYYEVVKEEVLCDHRNAVVVERKEPTCTESGNEAYVACPDCEKLFENDSFENELDKAPIIKALGHDLKTTGYKAPTYTSVGSTGKTTCTRCDYVKKATTIAKLVSQYVLGNITRDSDVDFIDAINVLKFSVSLINIDNEQEFLGDVNNDGVVNYADAILILRKDAGIIKNF